MNEQIYQVEEKVADDPDYGLLAHLTVDEILEKYSYLKPFESDMQHGMFSICLVVDLWELRITHSYTIPQLNAEHISKQPLKIPY